MGIESTVLGVRRRYAGIMFTVAGLATWIAVLAQSTPDGSALHSAELAALYGNRALIALLLWIVASISLVVGCILTASTLRGPKTGTTLAGCILLAVSSLLFFGTWIATAGTRYMLGVASANGTDVSGFESFLAVGTLFLFVVTPLLVAGGTVLSIGLDRTGVSSWFAGATWAVAIICYALVAGVWWAETLAAGAIGISLMAMGIDVAKFRPHVLLNEPAGTRLGPWAQPTADPGRRGPG